MIDPSARESIGVTITVERPTHTRKPGARESHVPRDELERPLVGLCGTVRSGPGGPYDAAPGERATCAVCDDLWNAGFRPRNWGAGT